MTQEEFEAIYHGKLSDAERMETAEEAFIETEKNEAGQG